MVKENKMVSPYFLFFMIHASQIGISFLSFQTDIIQGAGHDSWISVLGIGFVMHALFLMMLFILKHSSAGDILSFHKNVFGKWIGGLLNLIMAVYFATASLYVLYSYIDILQVWVFDGIPSWEFSLFLSILIFYIVVGGFRIVTAIAYWGVVIPIFMLVLLLYFFDFIEISYLSPIFQHEIKDYFISAKEAAPIYFGFETTLVFYPFIKDKKKASKWGMLALLLTTILYTGITILTFMFYTQGKLEHLAWPTLTMIKIIGFPFLERFEFIFIFTWLLVVMPVICIYLWSAIRSIKRTIPKAKPTYLLVGLLVAFHFINSLLNEIQHFRMLEAIVNYSGLVFIFGYVPILFLISVVRAKWMKNINRKN